MVLSAASARPGALAFRASAAARRPTGQDRSLRSHSATKRPGAAGRSVCDRPDRQSGGKGAVSCRAKKPGFAGDEEDDFLLDMADKLPPLQSEVEGPPEPPPPKSPRGPKPLHQPGDVIASKYTVAESLGSGMSGTTYKASDPDGKDVAVKAVSLRSNRDWKVIELFEREANVLKQLSHPGIPAYSEYLEVDTEKDRALYLVQELVEGKSLADMVRDGARLEEAEIKRIALELLSVLEYLGSLRPPVVHRDVKPENIIIEGGKPGGRVYLVDFGGVQEAAGGGADSFGSTIVGTYGYMAPEQFRGRASTSSDIYALGATLLFLASRRVPGDFPAGPDLSVDFDEVEMGWELRETISGMLEPLERDRLGAADARAELSGEGRRKPSSLASTGGNASGSVRPFLPNELLASCELASGAKKRPVGAVSTIESTSRKLVVNVPAQGITGDTVATGGFAVAWNAFVALWTTSAITGGAPILFTAFSIPFWLVGGTMAKQTVDRVLIGTRLEINRDRFSLVKALLGRDNSDGGRGKRFGILGEKDVEGSTADLRGVRLNGGTVINGEPQTEVELLEGALRHTLGGGVSTVEQEWIASEVATWLEENSGAEPGSMLLPPSGPTESLPAPGGGMMGGGLDMYDPMGPGRGRIQRRRERGWDRDDFFDDD